MKDDIYPLQVLLWTLSGWVNRQQQDVIAYLVEENRVLKEQMKDRRLRLTDEQRRRLAAKAKRLGRKTLNRFATIVTPDTIMRWHRRLIALKWNCEARRFGRPGLMKRIAALIVRMARENSGWGYCRIQGELKQLGHRVAPITIAKVLKENGIKSVPDRPLSWKTFLQAHWGGTAGMDFVTTKVWTLRGLMTYDVLFVIDLKSREVHFAGATPNSSESFMAQVARNLTDAVDGLLTGHRFLICDRDSKFSEQFRRILKGASVDVIRTPIQAPICNAYAERFVLSIKSKFMRRMIFFGEAPLRRAISEYLDHCHSERAHQGLGNDRIENHEVTPEGAIRCRERLGGILKHYFRAA